MGSISIRAISDSITREVRKGLGQCDAGVRGRERASLAEINKEIDDAQDRLAMAYQRRDQYYLRLAELFGDEKIT